MFLLIINIIVMLWAGRDSYWSFMEGHNKMGWFLLIVSAFNAAAVLSYVVQ